MSRYCPFSTNIYTKLLVFLLLNNGVHALSSNKPAVVASSDILTFSDLKARSLSVEDSIRIASSFQPSKFNPPTWAKNSHFQTIVGGLYRHSCMYTENNDLYSNILKSISLHQTVIDGFVDWDDRQRFKTPDGDFFDVDYKYTIGGSERGLVVMTHGLESSSSSALSRDLATSYNEIGMDVACINFRGCSGEPNNTPGSYHLGFTSDLEQFLEYSRIAFSQRPVYLSGFSLGANVVVKLLTEVGSDAFDRYNIHGAAVNAVPLDIKKIAPNLSGSKWEFSTLVYGNNLLKKLQGKALGQIESLSETPFDLDRVKQSPTIRDFEEASVCVVYGFKDATDYYEQSSVYRHLGEITVPLYVINSDDDPFFGGDIKPDIENASKTIKFNFAKHGGHCGFVYHCDNDKDFDGVKASWMPSELARFISHVSESI